MRIAATSAASSSTLRRSAATASGVSGPAAASRRRQTRRFRAARGRSAPKRTSFRRSQRPYAVPSRAGTPPTCCHAAYTPVAPRTVTAPRPTLEKRSAAVAAAAELGRRRDHARQRASGTRPPAHTPVARRWSPSSAMASVLPSAAAACPAMAPRTRLASRQGEGLEPQREPVALAILIRQDEERRQEDQQPHPREPDRPVAGVEQDGQEAAPLQALPGARARGHPDLAPEVERPGREGQCQGRPADPEQAAVQLPQPLAPDVARGASRGTRDQEEATRRRRRARRRRPCRASERRPRRSPSTSTRSENAEAGARTRARGKADHRAGGAGRSGSDRSGGVDPGRAAGRSGAKNAHAARPTAATAPATSSHDIQPSPSGREHGRAVVGAGETRR